MRRAAVFATFAAAFAVALPAAAQRPIEVEIVAPDVDAVVQGTVDVRGRASSAAGVRKAKLSIAGVSVADAEPSHLKQQVVLDATWDTAMVIGSSELAPNGEYTISMEATANGGASEQTSRRVIVDNPPRPPVGLAASPTESREIALDWSPNPEPDITGYRIERVEAEAWVTLVETESTTVVDAAEPGSYTYRVVALRKSAVDGTIESLPSEPVTAHVPSPAVASGGIDRSDLDRVKGVRIGPLGGFAGRGLPSGIGLPSFAGASGLPDLPSLEWGSYEEELPYDLPVGGIPLDRSIETASRAPWQVIPPDGLRWLAAGWLSLVAAALLRFIAVRVVAA